VLFAVAKFGRGERPRAPAPGATGLAGQLGAAFDAEEEQHSGMLRSQTSLGQLPVLYAELLEALQARALEIAGELTDQVRCPPPPYSCPYPCPYCTAPLGAVHARQRRAEPRAARLARAPAALSRAELS